MLYVSLGSISVNTNVVASSPYTKCDAYVNENDNLNVHTTEALLDTVSILPAQSYFVSCSPPASLPPLELHLLIDLLLVPQLMSQAVDPQHCYQNR